MEKLAKITRRGGWQVLHDVGSVSWKPGSGNRPVPFAAPGAGGAGGGGGLQLRRPFLSLPLPSQGCPWTQASFSCLQ